MRHWLILLIALAGCRNDDGKGTAPSSSAAAPPAKIYFADKAMPVRSVLLQRAGDGVEYLFASSRELRCEELPRIASVDAEQDAAERVKMRVSSPESIEMRAAVVEKDGRQMVARLHFGLVKPTGYELNRNFVTRGLLEGQLVADKPIELAIDNGTGRLAGMVTPRACPGLHVHSGTPVPQPEAVLTLNGKPLEIRGATLSTMDRGKNERLRLIVSSEPIDCDADPIQRFVPWALGVLWRDGHEDHVEVELMTIARQRYSSSLDKDAKLKRDGDMFEVEATAKQFGYVAKLSGKIKPTLCVPPKTEPTPPASSAATTPR